MPQARRREPTRETYQELQQAYDHFNRELFAGALPPCLMTLQREKNTCGYFSPGRFVNAQAERTDEIALNPAYFAVVPLTEVLQTVVHEMAHLWQHHFGAPGRRRYHNDEWADKMESLGLIPSSTGRPGGRRTGEKMSDYAEAGGAFLHACDALLTERFTLSWVDRFPAVQPLAALVALQQAETALAAAAPPGAPAAPPPTDSAARPAAPSALLAALQSRGVSLDVPVAGAAANRSLRVKYTCPECGANAWGKPGLRLICEPCGMRLEGAGKPISD